MDEPPPALRTDLFRPGARVAVAVSGGADSVALLRRLIEERSRLGIILSIAHVHHGIRGEEANKDAEFVAGLAAAHDLPLHMRRVDAPAAAALRRETLEEAARSLRYAFFEELIAQGDASSVATAHTLDDQAETVLYKLLRGAWTEGLSGIHPVLQVAGGSVLRPFLGVTHAAIRSWLRRLDQPWREDASNRDPAYTRNRIRHELLPLLSTFNPGIARQLSRMAAISSDEEQYWQGELDRLLPSLLLPGKAVRGGGRSNSTRPDEATVALELERLQQLQPAVRRRVLRAAARQVGARLGFGHTEELLELSDRVRGPRGRKVELPGQTVAQRTLRELRITHCVSGESSGAPSPGAPEYPFAIPGEVNAPALGLHLRGELAQSLAQPLAQSGEARSAVLRNWRPGDRVEPLHSRGPKKVKQVLDRLRVSGRERELWPVVEISGKIVWMLGVEVNAPEFVFTSHPL